MNVLTHQKFLQQTWHIIKNMYITWFKYWWWLIALYIVANLLIFVTALSSCIGFLCAGIVWDSAFLKIDTWHWPYYIYSIMLSALFTVYYATLIYSAKPNQEPYNYRSFFKYINHIGIVGGWFCIVSVLYHSYWYGITIIKKSYAIPYGFAFDMIHALVGAVIIIFNVFLMISLFSREKASFKQGFMQAIHFVCSLKVFLIISIVLLINTLLPHYIVYITMNMGYTVKAMYLRLCYDLLVSAPLLVGIATSFYYQRLNSMQVTDSNKNRSLIS